MVRVGGRYVMLIKRIDHLRRDIGHIGKQDHDIGDMITDPV